MSAEINAQTKCISESNRLASLHRLNILDTEPEQTYNQLVTTAAGVCDAPISAISFIDEKRQWFKASTGMHPGVFETPRDIAFCTHVLENEAIFEVSDATTDVRFSHNPLVVGSPYICFYAGAPLQLSDGSIVGTLCVVDRKQKSLTPVQRTALENLAGIAVSLLEAHQLASELANNYKEVLSVKKTQQDALKVAHEQIQLASDSGKIGMWDWNIKTKEINWNSQMYSLYDQSHKFDENYSGQIPFDQWISLLHPDDRKPTLEVLEHALQAGDFYDSDHRLLCQNGTMRYLRSSGHVTRDQKGQAIRLHGVSWDDTPIRRLSSQILEQHELLRVTLKSIGDAVITTDSAGRVNWLNPAAEKLTGWSVEEAQGSLLEQVFRVIDEDSRTPITDHIITCMKHGPITDANKNCILIKRDGTEINIEDSVAPIKNQTDNLLGIVLTFRDVTENRRQSTELQYRATHDPLTDLVNRAEFENTLESAFNRCKNKGQINALMYIDLDRFKTVNDSCGHKAGDELLQKTASVLSQHVRSTDTLARIGGDEFAVILEECTCQQAHRVALDICKDVAELKFVRNGKQLQIGTSIGLVPLDVRWESTADILQAADSCCYAAKKAGRSQVHVLGITNRTSQSSVTSDSKFGIV